MVDVEVGVQSIGSRGGASADVVEGRIGMDLWRCGSAEKGLRRASATEAMALTGVGKVGCAVARWLRI